MDAVSRELSAIKAALEAVEGLVTVTTGWPKGFDCLPCALVRLAGERPLNFRDNAEYLTAMEWYVYVFAAKEAAMLPLCERVQAAMTSLGYARSLRWEEGDADVRQTVFRFAKTM